MPDVRIQHSGPHRASGLDPSEVTGLMALLGKECAQRFTLDEWPLTEDDFSFYDEVLSGRSRQTHDVIIRISLHHFETRVLFGQSHADELAYLVSEFLNGEELMSIRGYRCSVGVSLLFAEIAWASA